MAVAEGDVVGLEAGVVAAVVVIASLMVEGSAEETFVGDDAATESFFREGVVTLEVAVVTSAVARVEMPLV